jgi:hypothetical protein
VNRSFLSCLAACRTRLSACAGVLRRSLRPERLISSGRVRGRIACHEASGLMAKACNRVSLGFLLRPTMIAWTALFCQLKALVELRRVDYILAGTLLWLSTSGEFLSAAVEPHVAPVSPRYPHICADGTGPYFFDGRSVN